MSAPSFVRFESELVDEEEEELVVSGSSVLALDAVLAVHAVRGTSSCTARLLQPQLRVSSFCD